jgi:hypothetical protein
MSQIIHGHFDGAVLIPDEPLHLAPGLRVRIQVDPLGEVDYPLTRLAELATDMGISDLAETHAGYARRQPKSEA